MADVPTPVDEVQGGAKAPAENAKAAPAAAMPPTAAAFAGKAKDLSALRDAVVDAANVGAGLWFSYLFVLLYLIVAVGSVTHRNLLFESPLKLPFLSVDLPLVGFFVLGPALFLIVHAYVLLHFAMLAGKVGVFHAELQAQIADEDVRARLRRQLPSNIFVQFLAGPIEVRSGLMGTLLRLIAQISLVAGPLALLVFFQLQFLPYHNEAVSWWQRIAVVADLAILWALWPSVARGERSSIGWRDFRRPHVAGAALASLLPILLVFTIATFPNEWLDKNPLSPPIVPQFATKSSGESTEWSIRWRTLHQVLLVGDVDLVARKPTSLWSNRLVLPNLEVKPEDNLSLRGRNLEGAVLLGAKLPRMDFTAAQLRGAVLNEADLREAKFLCARSSQKIGDDSPDDDAPPAGEKCVDLQNAYLEGTRLQGAEFQNAQLQGTNLFQADLRGLKLNDAHLEGAMLNQAQLQGASLAGAQMQGASLQSAVLHGAGLRDAQLQGAALDYAQLQGATLIYTALEGASLEGALLEGAVLDDARMPGVVLSSADLTNASLQKVLTWRATGESVKGDPRVVAPQITAMRPESVRSRSTREATANCVGFNPCDWTADTFAALQRLIVDLLPRGSRRDRALNRIAILDPDTPMPAERSMENLKVKLAQSPPSADDYDKSLAESFRQIGCNKDDAPYVIRGWLRDHRLAGRGPAWRALAVAFLDPANCPGARGLSDQEMADLRTMRDRAAP